MAQPHFKQIRGTVLPAQVDLSTASAPTHPASRQFVSDAVQQSIFNMDGKDSVRVASTVNIASLSGLLTVDGITLVDGNRVLVKNQTSQQTNGIYVAAAAGWSRATDFDGSTEVTSQSVVSVEQGTTNANTTWRLSGTGPFTVGTSNLVFQLFSSAYFATPSTANKNMAALATTVQGDLICNTGLAATPASGSYVTPTINGVDVSVGDAVKTADTYFSGDTGTTARALNAVASGDKLYRGATLGYATDTTDTVSFDYVV